MSISTRIIIIFLTILGLLSAVVVLMNLLAKSRQKTAMAELQRLEPRKLADQLRQSSDNLIRMARTYVVTDDAIYEQYFHEILEIRDGTSSCPMNYGSIYRDNITATKETPITLEVLASCFIREIRAFIPICRKNSHHVLFYLSSPQSIPN